MSERTLAQKLLIKPGYKILLLYASDNYKEMLLNISSGADISTKPEGSFDIIQIFVNNRIELENRLSEVKKILNPKVIFWVTYPKETSKIKTGINRDSIREYCASVGFETVSMFSVDDVWSAMRLKSM